MRAVVATSRAYHLHHLAIELARHGWEIEFHSYLPRWKTRQYGLPDSATVSHFLPLLPFSALAFLRINAEWLTTLRQRLSAMVDRRIARTMGKADLFIGLSSVAVESALKARQQGAFVLIERGSSHVRHQLAVARQAGHTEPTDFYIDREEASYAAADRIVLLSRYARETFSAAGVPDDRIEVMPLGTDLDRFAAPAVPPPLPVRALVVGAWNRRKGCDLIPGLLAALPDLTVTQIGVPGDAPLPRHPRLVALGPRPQAEVAEIMRQHHLLLFPSRDDGFGMVMAEALASGMRVVASTACGGPELAEVIGHDYVSLVEPGSLEQLIAATRTQCEAIAAAPEQAAAPAAAVRALSWQGYGERYLAMVRRLLEGRQ